MIKYICIFRLVLTCFLAAGKNNLTGFSTGLTGRSKNFDPTDRSTRPVSSSDQPVQQKWQHFKDRNPNTTPSTAICTKTICFLQIYTISIDRLAFSGRACTAFPKHIKKMCHFDSSCLWPVQCNTSWSNISLPFKNQHFIWATAYGTLSPLLTSLKLQIWTLSLTSFFAVLTFPVYLPTSPQRKLFKSVLTPSAVRNTLLHLFTANLCWT